MFIEALQLLFLFMYCTGPHTRTKSTFSLSLKGIIIVSNVTVESIKDTSCTQTKLCLFRGYQTVVDGSCVCKRAHYAKMRYQIKFNTLFLQKKPIRKNKKKLHRMTYWKSANQAWKFFIETFQMIFSKAQTLRCFFLLLLTTTFIILTMYIWRRIITSVLTTEYM